MKKTKVIQGNNLPMKTPIPATVLYLMAADYFNLPEWAWTLIIVLLSLGWILKIISIFTTEKVNIFKDETNDENKPVKRSKFQERLNQISK